MIASFVTALCLAMPSGATVVDPFRAPSCDRCAGNRGLDLALIAGRQVPVGLDGTVWFAGRVAGRNYVVVRAARDRNVRVTYGGLVSIAVSVGQRLDRGEAIGTSADTLFIGVRIGDRYVDPLSLRAHDPGSERQGTPRFRITVSDAPAGRC